MPSLKVSDFGLMVRKNHITAGINRTNKHHVQYPDVLSAIRLIPHSLDLPVSDCNMEYSSDSEFSDMTIVAGDDAYKPEENDQLVP